VSEYASHGAVAVGSERSFGVVMAIAFAVVACLPLLHDGAVRIWALWVAGAFLAAGLFVPVILKPLNWLWFKLGLLLGMIVAPVVMLALFLIAFTPMALILRLMGKDPMRRKFDPKARSYWINRGGEGGAPPMGSMRNQF
jgi:hypothetical protein